MVLNPPNTIRLQHGRLTNWCSVGWARCWIHNRSPDRFPVFIARRILLQRAASGYICLLTSFRIVLFTDSHESLLQQIAPIPPDWGVLCSFRTEKRDLFISASFISTLLIAPKYLSLLSFQFQMSLSSASILGFFILRRRFLPGHRSHPYNANGFHIRTCTQIWNITFSIIFVDGVPKCSSTNFYRAEKFHQKRLATS